MLKFHFFTSMVSNFTILIRFLRNITWDISSLKNVLEWLKLASSNYYTWVRHITITRLITILHVRKIHIIPSSILRFKLIKFSECHFLLHFELKCWILSPPSIRLARNRRDAAHCLEPGPQQRTQLVSLFRNHPIYLRLVTSSFFTYYAGRYIFIANLYSKIWTSDCYSLLFLSLSSWIILIHLFGIPLPTK
jgi:hypothetical protein